MQGSGGEEYGREADKKLYTINLLIFPKCPMMSQTASQTAAVYVQKYWFYIQ